MMKWSYRQKDSCVLGGKKAYIREGTALQQLGQHADALAAFASGLAQDPNNASLLSGLVESALKCPLKDKLEPIFQQLQNLKLDKSPFVIISVVGQDLLQAGHYQASVQMLECALKIGTCSLKLKGSVFSALSSAYWGLGNIDKAIVYMQQDLKVAKSLGDQDGECRAYGNLGSAYFSKGQYKEALSHDRFQLVLAMRLKDRQTATVALSSLGHVYTAIGDYPNAMQSHKQSVLLLKQSNEKLSEAREIGNVGAVYLAMANFEGAVECHLEHLKIAKSLKNSVEEARAYSNLGSAYHYKRNYEKAITYHKHVLKIGEQRLDKSLEARAYAGLGHAARCMQDYSSAKMYHEKQLDNALQTRDKVAEGRACSNLGIIYHQLAEFDAALKLHKVHLSIAKDLGDHASQGRSFGNIGNAYSSLREYEQAVKFHKQELAISTEVNDRHSEASTHGNLAVAYQALKMFDSAHQHYVAHLNISRELKDAHSEARAVCNLGNFHSSRGEYTNSIPYYEQYLMLSQELHDLEGEAKACFFLGYAHFAMRNFPESVRYYEQDLSIVTELKDQLSIARAYCNLGLGHRALNNLTEALECQKKCLNMMTVLKNVKGKFRALGNIGDILLKTGETTEAVKFYNQQLQLAKQSNNQDLLASANGALGAAHRVLGQHDKALAYHTQELSVRQDMNDLKGECRAHGNLGNVHMTLGKYMNAFKCYEEQLEKSRELQDSALEANACGNLAITKMNMGNFEEAIGMFEQQLAMLEQVRGSNSSFDKGRAFGNLGDCYEALGDCEEAIKCHEQYLAIAQNAPSLSDQDKAYRGLGNAHRSVGNLQQALVCFEKRLVVAHELNSSAAKASAYGELGCLHSLLGNFEQAISCLQHQLNIAKEMNDRLCEGDAACGLGGVYQQMGEYEKALEYHEMDLHIAEATNNTACQCRAYGNLGLSHESLGEYQKAIRYQEQHLSIAAQMNDRVAKTLAYSSLGRVHHALNNHPQAVEYLRQGLQIAEQLGRMEDEAKIRHRLGLALWGKGDFDECQQQLYKAAELFESIRRDAQFNSEYKLSLFDLQTACYQALQRVLVTLDRHEEALVVAERACTRAFIDLLMERQAGSEGFYGNHVSDPPPITTDQITSIITKQKSLVLCFSVAAGFLYSWLLTPKSGIVKFHETSMADVESEADLGDNISMKSSASLSSCSLLDSFVGSIRESMGVEAHAPSGPRLSARSVSLEAESDTEEQWEQHLEELGDKLNAENDRSGFLRIVNRNHLFNSSNYSLSSLFSVSASLNGCSASFPGVSRKNSVRSKFGNKSAISALYQLLFEPFEECIKEAMEDLGNQNESVDMILVLQGDLYLIPFSVLRKDQTMDYLFERFNLIVMPSLTSLQNLNKHDKHGRPVIDSTGAIVVGNPKLTPMICQHWHLRDIPTAEYEARIVGEILTARPLIGQEATKVAVLNQIEQVEVIHFAAHVSWKLSSVILSPGEVPSHPARFPTIDSDDSSSDISSFDGPSLSEYLLTAADILNLKLHAKLVVLSAGYTDDRAGRINSDGVVGLTRSLLSAGAQCVLYCLWPVPDQASKLLMKTFYVCLQEGKYVSQALAFALKTVQTTKQFSHPSNWGGWVLMGQDVKLSSKVAQMGHAICELLQQPSQCREAMRVLLHLIEKSLQRIHQGQKNSMYTTAQSIENKVVGLGGWKDLLQAVGFRFEPSTNGLAPAVFFPQSDPGGRLTQASASLQALLGLPQGSISALAKFLSHYDTGEAIIRVMRDILSKMAAKETNMEVKVGVKVWRINGCHEFLASLSMDLVEVGNDEITLRLGKQANKRHLQFALQALVAIFDTQEAPRTLTLDSSSSLESLSSSHSGSTSTSTFSKGSTPPMSPRSKKKSLFNPAEMEKMRTSNRLNRMSQGGLTGRNLAMGGARLGKNGVGDPSLCLAYQNQIKHMYPTAGSSSNNSQDGVEVRALSDSDTPVSMTTTSPDLGSSSASEKMQSLIDSELEPTWYGRDNSTTPIVRSARSSISDGDVTADGSYYESGNDNDREAEVPEELVFERSGQSRESEELVFERSGQSRESEQLVFERSGQSRESEGRSVTGGNEFERNSEKRTSDYSDTSVLSEGRLTPKNQLDIKRYLNQTDGEEETNVHQLSCESGIVSETASSNQSEGSQQSDQSNFRYDPTDVAQKIMSEVSKHKSALDTIQKMSVIHSRQESNEIRTGFQSQMTPAEANSHAVLLTTSDQTKYDSKFSPSVADLVSKGLVQSKISSFNTTSQSAFTNPVRVPPPVAVKPNNLQMSGFRNFPSNQKDIVSSGNSVNTHSSSTLNCDTDQSKVKNVISTNVRGKELASGPGTTTAITVNKTGYYSPPTPSTSTTMSFSSFRPTGKSASVSDTSPNNMETVSSPSSLTSGQFRSESTTSTSSYCSTPSSMKSVIYRPDAGNSVSESPQTNNSPTVSVYDSGSGSASTVTPTINLHENQNELSHQKRDSSPALSTGSSASSKCGKQKKKVSFSDSEPSDTPSPMNSSSNSNQMSYFDLSGEIGRLHKFKAVDNLAASQSSLSSSFDSIPETDIIQAGQPRVPVNGTHVTYNQQSLTAQYSPQSNFPNNNPNTHVNIPNSPLTYNQPNFPTGSQPQIVKSTNSQMDIRQNNNNRTPVSPMRGVPNTLPLPPYDKQNNNNYANSPQSYHPPSIPYSPKKSQPVVPQQTNNSYQANIAGVHPTNQMDQRLNPISPREQYTQQRNPRTQVPNSLPLSSVRHLHDQGYRSADSNSSTSPREYIPPHVNSNEPGFGSAIPNVKTNQPLEKSSADYNYHQQSNSQSQPNLYSPTQNSPRHNPSRDFRQGHSQQTSIQGPVQGQKQNFNYGQGQRQNFSQSQGDLYEQGTNFSSLNAQSGNPVTRELPRQHGRAGQRNSNLANQNLPPPRRNPPVPPARIDSWESMDKRLNGPEAQSLPQTDRYVPQPQHPDYNRDNYGHTNNIQLSTFTSSRPVNGLPSEPTSPAIPPRGHRFQGQQYTHQGQQFTEQGQVSNTGGVSNQNIPPPEQYWGQGNSTNKQLPSKGQPTLKVMNGPVTPHQFTNGNVPQFQNYGLAQQANNQNSNTGPVLNNQIPAGPLKRVSVGSDKRSFARTNVLQSSKC